MESRDGSSGRELSAPGVDESFFLLGRVKGYVFDTLGPGSPLHDRVHRNLREAMERDELLRQAREQGLDSLGPLDPRYAGYIRAVLEDDRRYAERRAERRRRQSEGRLKMRRFRATR